jgi:hypothetical protein
VSLPHLSCGVFLPPLLLQAFPLLIAELVLLLLLASMFIYSSHGRWVFPASCGVFLPPPLLQAFLLQVAGLTPTPALSGQAWLVYLQFREGFHSPPFGAQGTPPSLQCVFIVLTAYYSVFLFSLGGGRSVQGAMLIWPRVVCGSTAYRLAHLVHVFPSIWAQATDGPGALLVSPFNVKWRCSAQVGGVEGSKFCLFLVTLPARCVSRVAGIIGMCHHVWHKLGFYTNANI